MSRLVVLSLVNFIRNPLRQAVLFPWVILTVERWAEVPYQLQLSPVAVVQGVGTAAIAVGAVLCLITMGQFVVDGAGTPEPFAPPTTLITRGVFRLSRNPLYLGMAIVLLGEATLYESVPLLIYALYWVRQFQRRVQREEMNLLRRYGASYVTYSKTTPRWIAGFPVSALTAIPPETPVRGPNFSPTGRRRGQLDLSQLFRTTLRQIGTLLTGFALVGYLNTYIGVFSTTGTPFLWFDPVENIVHLALGLILLTVAFLPVNTMDLAPTYQPLLIGVGLILLFVALTGLIVATASPPNVLGITNFENPVENVIHWVAGIQCLFVATRKYLMTTGPPERAPWRA